MERVNNHTTQKHHPDIIVYMSIVFLFSNSLLSFIHITLNSVVSPDLHNPLSKSFAISRPSTVLRRQGSNYILLRKHTLRDRHHTKEALNYIQYSSQKVILLI